MPLLDASCEAISLDTIKQVIKMLKKNYKATGECDISRKILKAANENTLQDLLSLYNLKWQTKTPTQQGKIGIFIKLPQHGNLSACSNWRRITLLSILGTLFCGILMYRLKQSDTKRGTSRIQSQSINHQPPIYIKNNHRRVNRNAIQIF